jgi:L-rhamnose 1-dehydrogenase
MHGHSRHRSWSTKPLLKHNSTPRLPPRYTSQVNTLLPGAINTPFLNTMLANPRKLEYILGRIPLGRIGVAQDMVGPALFLASHASDYVTGAEILVDGGGAALPMLAAQDPDAYKA